MTFAVHNTPLFALHNTLLFVLHNIRLLAEHNSLLVMTRPAQVAHSDRAAYRWILAQAAPLVTSMATASQTEGGQQEQEAADVAARAKADVGRGGAPQADAEGLRRPGARAETSTQAAGEERKAVTLQAGRAGARPPAQSSTLAAGREREAATLQANATGEGIQATSVQASAAGARPSAQSSTQAVGAATVEVGETGARPPGLSAQSSVQAAGGDGQAKAAQASATGARLPALSAQNTATVLWAYGRVGGATRPLVLALASRCRQLASEGGFTAQGASMALWGLATLRFWDQVRRVQGQQASGLLNMGEQLQQC